MTAADAGGSAPSGAAGGPPPVVLVAALLAAAALSRFVSLPSSAGEIDEAVFAGALLHYDLSELSPHAPGFPVWIWIGRLALAATGDPYRALSLAAAVLAALAPLGLFLWVRSWWGPWEGLCAAVLYSFVPAVAYFAARAYSEGPATALFVWAFAMLALARQGARPPGAAAARLAVLAGVLAGMGAGVRPHFLLVFGPALGLEVWRLRRDGGTSRLAWFCMLGAACSTLMWGSWLLVQAGGPSGLAASVGERAHARQHGFQSVQFGTLLDSFLVRDLLTVPNSLMYWGLAAAGLAASYQSVDRRLFRSLVLLTGPALGVCWLLQNREFPRYSIPVVAAGAICAGGALVRLASHPWVALGVAGALALSSAVTVYPDMAAERRAAAPPIAGLRFADRQGAVLVVDEVFLRFARTETWLGRFRHPFLSEAELLEGATDLGSARFVRLHDFTREPQAWALRRGWTAFEATGRIASSLGNDRLLLVGVRNPSPPLAGLGFGVIEQLRGAAPFRWAGAEAHLLFPRSAGRGAVFLRGKRFGLVGGTIARAFREPGARLVLERRLDPGAFEWLVPPPSATEDPTSALRLTCDRPIPLPPLAEGRRPLDGCFVLEDVDSFAAEELWEATPDGGVRVDLGSERDGLADPIGFQDREATTDGLTFRWTAAHASVLWLPRPGFRPERLSVRWRTPGPDPVAVRVSVDSRLLPEADSEASVAFRERTFPLPQEAQDALSSGRAVRIGFAVNCLRLASDPRDLGVAIDRITVYGDDSAARSFSDAVR